MNWYWVFKTLRNFSEENQSKREVQSGMYLHVVCLHWNFSFSPPSSHRDCKQRKASGGLRRMRIFLLYLYLVEIPLDCAVFRWECYLHESLALTSMCSMLEVDPASICDCLTCPGCVPTFPSPSPGPTPSVCTMRWRWRRGRGTGATLYSRYLGVPPFPLLEPSLNEIQIACW